MMKYFVEGRYSGIYQEFEAYREAEIYCGMHGISGEDIYEIEEEGE